MKDNLYAMKCLNPSCGKVLVYLGKMGENAFGLIKDDGEKRFFTDEKGSYIVCKFCGKKNAFISTREKGLPIFKLSYIRED